MKINWGTGIVLAFVAFISFIVFFVVKMHTTTQANHELVTEDYYKVELNYQKEIDAQKNAKSLSEEIQFKKTTEGLLLTFPEEINEKTEGVISLYRPSNKHLDFTLPLRISNSYLLIPDKSLLGGRWDIKVSWEENGKDYLHKEKITY